MARSSTPSSAPPPASDWRGLSTLPELELAARALLPPTTWAYFASGADDERTLARNRRAFREHELWPRVLVDVSRCRPNLRLLGDELAAPILVAPTACQTLAHPDGELATARGAARAGTINIVSTLSSYALEEIAAATAAPKWFQLYVHRDRGLTTALIERARAAGYRALVLTVDTPVLGRRAGVLPDGVVHANFAGLADAAAGRHEPKLSWADLEWLQALAGIPVVVKGVLRADDAARAAAAGVAALIVSNHGGRQLDGVPATLDALPGVALAVAGRCPVLVDGGVRSGTDVLKAVALGAAAVCVGRPILWGLACGGEDGVARVLGLLAEELERAMALAGCPDLAALPPDLVRRR